RQGHGAAPQRRAAAARRCQTALGNPGRAGPQAGRRRRIPRCARGASRNGSQRGGVRGRAMGPHRHADSTSLRGVARMTVWQIILFAVIKLVALVLVFVMGLTSVLTWAERRQSAMAQDRLGPNRANIGSLRAWGLFHFLADALKMMFKEDVTP